MRLSTDAEFVVDDLPARQRQLRIAVVTETYPPEVNGVAMTLAVVVDGLRRRDHRVQLVRPRQPGADAPGSSAAEEVLTRGVPIPRYGEMRMGLPCAARLSRLWRQQRPDVVHIATEGPLGWSALQAARRLSLPTTSDFRTNFHAYCHHYGMGWLGKPMMGYLRRFHNRTQRTMVPSESLRRELAAAGFERVSVVARGVDTVRFSPALRSEALRAQWGAGAQTPVALCVGRLAMEKNPQRLAAAFLAMRQRRDDARLVLVGDGPARDEYRRLMPDAVFVGQRTGDDLAAHYASADMFLFPSETETFGNVVPEAMASGLAVVAFDLAAAGQLIHSGETGLLAPAGCGDDFVAHALRLVGDPAEVSRLGCRARQRSLEQGWDRIIDQVEAVLLDAVGATVAYASVRGAPAGVVGTA